MDKLKTLLPPVLLFALVMGVTHWHGLTRLHTERERLGAELDVLCSHKAETLEEILSRLLRASEMLATLISQDTLDRRNFDTAATAVRAAFPGVETMGFTSEDAPGPASRKVGSEKHGAASGGESQESVATLSGPFRLHSGQTGFMGRAPVFEEQGRQHRLLGFVTAVMTLETAEKLAGLGTLAEYGYGYGIEVRAGASDNWELLSGEYLRKAMTTVRPLHIKGVTLRLLLGRTEILASLGGYWEGYVGGTAIALSMSVLLFLHLRQAGRIRSQVPLRTAKLNMVNKGLGEEIRKRRQISKGLEPPKEFSRALVKNNGGGLKCGNAKTRGKPGTFSDSNDLQSLSELVEGLSGMRVLIVDDSPFGRHTAREVLGHAEIVATVAESGLLAVEALRREEFDAVLLDIAMPDMDGFETLKAIRELPGGKDLPVIALTGRVSHEDRIRSLEAGMDDHLTKPIDAASLFAALRLASLRRSGEREPAAMDSRHALALLMGNRELYARLLTGFLREYEESGQLMDELITSGATGDAVVLAHSIKGLAANLGGEKLSRASLELESALRESDTTRIPPALEAFKHAVREFSLHAQQTAEEMTRAI
ncbi:MAG: response regulator [Desulfovibrio sp.]|nr:response regulator [Desulfovibrio sp.]MBI4958887.1 response regulator [Desulfovibrio sp.]